MAQLLVLVIDQEEQAWDILSAWERVGVPGVTLIDSTGSQHSHDLTRDDLPFVVSLRAVLEQREKRTQLLFSVIEDDNICEQAVRAVLQLLPDFEQGHRGIMFTQPIARVWGYLSAKAT